MLCVSSNYSPLGLLEEEEIVASKAQERKIIYTEDSAANNDEIYFGRHGERR